MSTPANGPPDPAPDQTIGFEPPPPAEPAATEHVAVNPTPRSGFGRPLASGSSRLSIPATFGKSLLTAAGGRVLPESLVGPYEILDELGKGGMGVVYKARHVHLQRIVALKMILGGANVSEVHLARFRLEAEAVAKLNHPNIVQVYDVGEHDGAPYLALELVEGGNLADKCAGKPQPPRFAAQTVETLARAVHAAHQAGVVHRDLKPQNVLMTLDGQPKVTDFGLAKGLDGNSGQTHAGSILGTPSYMAPEQAAGRIADIGPPTDVYALGCILYELLVGQPPFRGESPIATIRLVLDGEPVHPRAFQPHTPRDLDTICLKALNKPAHRRYPTAEALAEDLRRFLDGQPIVARPVGTAEWLWKWVRRNPTKATAFVVFNLFAVVLLLVGVLSYYAIQKRAHEAETARQEAKDNLDESTRRMIRLNVANGTKLLDSFDYLGAPLWFAEALRLESEKLKDEPGFAQRNEMHRIRLRAVFDHCPRTSHVWLHEMAMSAADYDAAGRYAVTASEDGIARVWDTADGRPVGPPLEHGAAVRAVAISHDGTRVATGGADGFVRLWQAADGRLLTALNNGAAVTKLLFSRDDKLVLTGGAAGRLRGWRPDGTEPFFYSFADRVTDVHLSADGRLVAAASRDGTARVIDVGTGQPVGPLLKHPDPPPPAPPTVAALTAVALTPDGKQVVTGSLDGSAVVWDVATGVRLTALRHGAAVNDVAVTADGKRVVTAGGDSTAKVWDLATGQPVGRPVQHDGPISQVAVSPDSRWAATAGADNAVRVWEVSTGNLVVPPLRSNALAAAVRFSPNGHDVLVADQTRVARVWNLITNGDLSGTTVRKAPTPAATKSAGRDDMQTIVSPVGGLSVAFGGGQAVRVRRAADHEPQTPPLRTGAVVTAADFSPDGTALVTGDGDGGVMAWATADGKALWPTAARHASKVVRAVYNPQGTAVVTTSDDNTARIWTAAGGAPLVPPIRLGAGVTAVAFGPDGKFFYTELATGRGRVWDATTGEPLTPPFRARDDWRDSLVVAKWSVDEMLAGGRMLSGQRLSPAGDVLPTDAVSLRDDWASLKDKYEIVAKTPPDALLKWRERQVAACLEAENWFAAGWHLDQLIRAKPTESEFRRQRAAVSAKLGDWRRAADTARQAVLLDPANPDGWYQRGVALGQLGEWRDAAACVSQAMRLKADGKPPAGLVAKVRLEAGDRDGYATACRELAERHRDTTDPATARELAWVCSLAADGGVDAAVLTRWADLATAEPVAALSRVRAGRPAEAAAKLKPLSESANPTAWAVYALALTRSGEAEAAKPWRAKAAAWLADQSGVPPTWDERADVEILLRELVP